jgi:hypothetical protein
MTPRNIFEQKQQATAEKISESSQMVQDHFDYGTITDVDYDSYQVQVSLYGMDVSILGSRYIPLINQREDIFLRWGMLRPGMWVRVHWRGPAARATWALAEIVGDENANFLTQEQKDNDGAVDTQPHKIFSRGGL